MSLRQQNKARARAGILESAQSLITERGVAGTTTREIAKRAGVSYQTLYNYFPTKGQLIQALVADDLETWRTANDEAIKHYNGDLLDTLTQMNHIGLRQFAAEQLELRREIGLQMVTQNSDQEQFAAINQISHERYHALLSMAQGMGQLQPDVDLHLMAHTLFCLTEYALLRYFLSPQPATNESGQNAVLQTLREQLALVITPYLT